MPICVVCGRSHNSKSKSDGITFHRLPSGPIQAEWITFAFECGIHASMLKPLHSLFCSEHFNKNCFEKYVRTTLLKPDSVPSIMVQRIKCAKVLYPEKTVSVALDLKNSSTNDTQNDIGVQVLSSEDSINNNCDPITASPGVSVEFITTPQKVSDKSVSNEIWGPDQDDTPKRSLLKRTVSKYIINDAVKSKKLKYLRQKVERQAKKIASMKMVISSLKQNNLLNDDELELFSEQFVEPSRI
ncbi:uncharacterized protein LOC126554711 [Aphis gossypii]|uniref:uncharacterized protein LOC126554711 n=1 Tax=Aphis gossypii TaxID=80765 RepID=UPI0021590EC3|nr:uncharacterized protein LOC126554711 [Aphis gossypii]